MTFSAVSAASSGVMTGRIGVSVIEPLSCTTTSTASPTFKRANSISALSKITPWELPTLEMVLTMM